MLSLGCGYSTRLRSVDAKGVGSNGNDPGPAAVVAWDKVRNYGYPRVAVNMTDSVDAAIFLSKLKVKPLPPKSW